MGNECPSKPIQMQTSMITAPSTRIIKSVVNHLGMRFSLRCGIACASMIAVGKTRRCLALGDTVIFTARGVVLWAVPSCLQGNLFSHWHWIDQRPMP
jgi:hypothetical protein